MSQVSELKDLEQSLANLTASVAKLPRLPGVYIMKAENEEIIYIGKAKSLRERVRSYFNNSDERAQIKFLLKRIAKIESIVTGTEEQAFILERDLINRHKPRYNIRLKDDKAYLSIRIDENVEWPKLELVRKVKQDEARYYGPYSFTYELRALLDIINKTIPLRTCSDSVLYNRQRPCLEYQIKRCAAPCCLDVDRRQYQAWINQARAVLEGRTSDLVIELNTQMQAASTRLDFEKAAELRDKLSILEGFGKNQTYISSGVEDRDIFGLQRDGSMACVSLLQVRYGRISDSRNFSFQDVHIDDAELMQAVLEQYYANSQELPTEVIVAVLPKDRLFIDAKFVQVSGKKIDLQVPKKGLKLRLLKLAELNAVQFYATSFESEANYQQAAQILAQLCKLKQLPRRIECVDISNMQGSDIVGAVVSFYDGVSDKQNYRRYKISKQDKPDDFASIYEVVKRRLERAVKDNDFPDLIIIDGGRGQLDAALQAAMDASVSIDLIGLAKERVKVKAGAEIHKPERIFLPGASEPIQLDPGKQVTNLVARIRDEVHRFVISYHRRTRARRVITSVLDELKGLGPERKRRLLKAFGSASNMRHIDSKELARIGRMPLSLANKLKDLLK